MNPQSLGATVQTRQIEHFNSFRTFIAAHAATGDAVHDVETLRNIYRKALYGPYGLAPAGEVDATSLARAIASATDLRVEKLVFLSASGTHADIGRDDASADLVQLLYQAAIGQSNAGRLSWHVGDRHGFRSRRFLQPEVLHRLELSIRDGGMGFRLPHSIRCGFGSALVNRLNRSVDIDIGVDDRLADTLIRSFCHAIHSCLIPYLRYTLAGVDEGKYSLMPLVEHLDATLPLCELPDSPGTWLVLAA
ncbi:MAG TPA: hypothetical protein VL500_00010 [Candidatus Eisenbacteria bacterium]|nr:hypothetical protein [Candidatus Eisenbacteria bacterium]